MNRLAVFKRVHLLGFLSFLLFELQLSIAQTPNYRQTLLDIKTRADTALSKYPPEKVYLQFDRPYYAISDTIWLRGWVVDAPTMQLSDRSALLHVEIATDSNEVVQQMLLPVSGGVTWGNIALNEKKFRPGGYIIRAYTNWMRNFGEEAFFYKHITIAGGYEDNWIVKLRTDTSRSNGKPNVKAVMQFAYADKTPVVGKPITMQVMSGRKTLVKQALDTELTGTVDISFKPPQTGKGLYISARVDNKGASLNIPLRIQNMADVDLQFMPEGGSLVAGIPARVAFKAIGADGKGVGIAGLVVDGKGNKLTSIQSQYRGMGSFTIIPVAGQMYTAKITLGGVSKLFRLPSVKDAGTALSVLNAESSDSLWVTIRYGGAVEKQQPPYFLIGKARGAVHYAAIIQFDGRGIITSYINKNLLPTGIAHIILTDYQGHTLNERLVFIDHKDGMKINVAPVAQIAAKDSVTLNIAVADKAGSPVQGTFAIGITDNDHIKPDTLDNDNLFTSLLLTSDLRGYVEAPAMYFGNVPAARQALDNLMLTQGWVNYDMPAKGPLYLAEQDYSVSGRLTNLFGKPSVGLGINLMSLKPLVYQDTVTNKDGRFKMMLPLIDTPAFILKAVKKNGKPSGIPITVNEFRPPPFTQPALPVNLPWYVNAGDTLINDMNANIKKRKLAEKLPEGTRLLQGVTITAKKLVKTSHNLNGAGNADLVLDEKDMEAAGKKTLLDLIQEKITGFHVSYPRKSYTPWYYVKGKFAIFIVDGWELYQMIQPQSYLDVRSYLQQYTAESVKGLELMYSAKYNFAYLAKYFPMADITLMDFAFIEITTRGGNGPFMPSASGIYLYKPLPLSQPAQFYKPKYGVNKANELTDNRPTIAWEPNVIIDTNGKASINFNAGPKPGNYTVTIQGIGVGGEIGVKYLPLKVVAAPSP